MADPELIALGRQRRDQIVELVASYRKVNHVAPSIAEIAQELEIEPSAVRRHIQLLIDEGRLVRMPGKARSLRVTKKVGKAS